MRIAVLSLVLASLVFASPPILKHTFENGDSGWIHFGPNGAVRVTSDPANVKNGKSALEFDYEITGTGITLAALPLPNTSLAGMRALRFWLKTDTSTAIAVVLSEKTPGGGNYSAVVWSPKDTWQQIELTPFDFALSEGPTDPKDSDNRLDLDQLQAVGLLDIGQILKPNPDFLLAVDSHAGKHSFYIDDFEVLSEPPPAAFSPAGVLIDSFSRQFLNWLTLGGADLSVDTSGKPLPGRAMRASYVQTQDRYIVLVHPLANRDLSKTDHLDLDIASENPAQLVIALEERSPGKAQGPRYNVTVEVEGGGTAAHRSVAFAAFEQDENGPPDPKGRLDLANLKAISVLDLTAAFTNETKKNTLWIGNIQAVKSDDERPKPRR